MDWQETPEAPELDTSRLQFEDMELYGGSGQDVLYGYSGADTDLGRVDRPGDLLNFAPLNTDFSGISVGGGGGVSSVSGEIDGAGRGIQGSVDLNTNGGSIGPLKRDFDAKRLSGEMNDAGPIRTEIGYSGPGVRYESNMERFETPLDGVGEVRRTLGVDDFSEDRRRVEDSVMSRYNRHFDRMEAELDTKLRAQGLVPGSEAYDTQFRQLREQENDATMQAILAGGQEQSRLFGLERDAALFENTAQQQEHAQSIDRGRFGLDVNAQNNQTALAADRFFNEAVGQSFQEALEAATFGNAAQGQQFGQNLQQALVRMDATERNNAVEEMRARLHNDAQRQFFEQTLANAGFGNQAQLDMGTFVNAAQAQGFDQNAEVTRQRIAAGSVNNQGADIANRHAIAAAQLELEAQKAANDAVLAQANFYNDSITQGLSNAIDASAFNNEMTQQEIDNAAAAADFYNLAQQQGHDQGIALADQQNAARRQNNTNAMTQQATQNEMLRQQYALDEASANQNNALRQAQLEEEAFLRSQPLNEIASLMSGGQLMMPQFTAPFQTGIPTVPIADYIQNEYEAKAAQSNALGQGLFGFGAALLGALPSDRRLKKDIRRIGRLSNGVSVYSYRFRHNDKADIGVMADEVGHIPGAVARVGGIELVNYQRVLGYTG